MSTESPGRRAFLRRSTTAGAGFLILPSARTAFGYRANEQFNLGVVGMKGYGAFHGFAQGIHRYPGVGYTISCDVDERKVDAVYDTWKKRAAEWAVSEREDHRLAVRDHYRRLADSPPPLYADFREMLEKEDKNIDAVVVATPDHTHASISAAALRAGKPVFAEKPLTISAHEARALHRLAKETGLPTQMNNHGAARPAFRLGLELIRDGLLGEVKEVHVFFSRGGRNFRQAPRGRESVPEALNWNLWLAQVGWRDYHPDWINRIAWRDTSIGELGNFGPHAMNLAFMALRVGDLWNEAAVSEPIRIRAEASEVTPLSYPSWERIRWEIPRRGTMPPVAFTWHHGPPPGYAPGSRAKLARLLLDHGAVKDEIDDLLPGAGCLVVGSNGLLATNSHNTKLLLLPKEQFTHVEQNRPLRLPTSPDHYTEWVNAAKGDSDAKPISNFEYAAPFAEFLNLGSLSTRFPGEEIEFLPHLGTVPKHERAAERLTYEYREGWNL